MEAYLQKLWERIYELIQMKIKLHNFVIFMILVKSTLNKMVAMVTSEEQQ